MKDINNLLKEHGVELDNKEAFEKEFFENYKTKAELDKKNEEIESLKASLESRENSVKELEKQLEAGGQDKEVLAETKAKLEKMTASYESERAEHEQKLKQQAYEFAIREQANGLKFSSNAAKEHFTKQAIDKNLSMEDGKVLGFDDFVKSYKEADADAFVSEGDSDKPRFAMKSEGKYDTDSSSKNDRPVVGLVR